MARKRVYLYDLDGAAHSPVDDAPQRWTGYPSSEYLGPIYGFGVARGVLTWPNSD